MRVLVVEDSELVRGYLENVIVHLGHEFVGAVNATEALDIMRRRGAGVDVLLIDVGLPEMDGVQLSERISELHAGIPTVFTTGNAGHPILASAPPSALVLEKPFGMGELTAILKQALGDSTSQAD
jgi:DNA-binding NtrC family response regulator